MRWYSATTKHREEPTVDGAVFGALTRAKGAYEEDSFDEGFNFVVEDVLDCMNSFRLRHHTKRGFLSVELDYQACEAVFDYVQAAGADPRDVVNAAVLAEVPHVVKQLTAGEEDDDGPGIMRDHVAAAARRRTGEDAPDKPVVWSPLPHADGHGALNGSSNGEAAAPAAQGRAHAVTLEFKPEAFALLEAARVNDGFASVADFCRTNLAGTVMAFCESLGGKDGEKMADEVFAAPPGK